MLFSEPKIPQWATTPSVRLSKSISVLFSEPKIPQSLREFVGIDLPSDFSALQRAENSSMFAVRAVVAAVGQISVLFSEPKIPQFRPRNEGLRGRVQISVLFSEPKIPQSNCLATIVAAFAISVLFSEPKIPQCGNRRRGQRRCAAFQCSSASRKFLNARRSTRRRGADQISVLFSEPKIPQSSVGRWANIHTVDFSALQRAENSSISAITISRAGWGLFQCSSASRKFLNSVTTHRSSFIYTISVLFSEPKIPQSFTAAATSSRSRDFSALQRAENSSITDRELLRLRNRHFSALQRAENSSM